MVLLMAHIMNLILEVLIHEEILADILFGLLVFDELIVGTWLRNGFILRELRWVEEEV